MLSYAALVFDLALLLLSATSGGIALLAGSAQLRTCGSGIIGLGTQTVIPLWSVRHRGPRSAFWGLAGSLSLTAVPPANRLLIDNFGWRTAWRIDAPVIWLVLLQAVALFVHNRLEEIGQYPDGTRMEDVLGTTIAGVSPDAGEGLLLREVTKTWSL